MHLAEFLLVSTVDGQGRSRFRVLRVTAKSGLGWVDSVPAPPSVSRGKLRWKASLYDRWTVLDNGPLRRVSVTFTFSLISHMYPANLTFEAG